jgi:hypothetical protein
MGISAAIAESHRRLAKIAFFALRQRTNDQGSQYLLGTGSPSVRLVYPVDPRPEWEVEARGRFHRARKVALTAPEALGLILWALGEPSKNAASPISCTHAQARGLWKRGAATGRPRAPHVPFAR